MPAEPLFPLGRRVWLAALVLLAAACGSAGSSALRVVGSDAGADAQVPSIPPSAPTLDQTRSNPTPTPGTTVPPPVFPGADWAMVAIGAGLDTSTAVELLSTADSVSSGCLAVVRGGEVLIEHYGVDARGRQWDEKTNGETWSVTKSVTATLVGIAQDMGHLDIDEAASTYLHEWKGTDSESVTVRQILTNTSGRHWSRSTDATGLFVAHDRSAYAIGVGQEREPDSQWRYNNAAIQTLEEVLERATGEDVGDFAETHLFGPIGMDVTFGRDASGGPGVYLGLQAGCLDMARFGLLALHGGEWDGERIVSADFMAEATATSTSLNESYGLLWWVNSPGDWEGVPTDAYAARGLGGQMVLVVPSLDIVVVRIGHTDGVKGYEGELIVDLGGLVAGALAS